MKETPEENQGHDSNVKGEALREGCRQGVTGCAGSKARAGKAICTWQQRATLQVQIQGRG